MDNLLSDYLHEIDFDLDFPDFKFNEDDIDAILDIEGAIDMADLYNMEVENENISSPSNEYLCKTCNESFEAIMNYIKHLQTHDEKHLYNCHLCDFGKIKTLSKIKAHLMDSHNINKSELTLSKTSKKVKRVAKKTEGKKTRSPISLCEICSEVFDNENLLNEHLKSHPYQHTCEICSKKLKLTIDFIEHRMQHSTDKLYRCILCTYNNRLICKMRSHLQSKHPNFRKYKCQICEERFYVLTQFVEHGFLHQGVKPFECKICSKTFMYSRYMNSHIKQEHVIGNFECQCCQETFQTKSERARHLKQRRRKTYQCDECGKVLSGLDKLKIHSRIHTGDKPYNCSFCEKCFSSSTRLKEHENIHKGIKPSQCNFCEKRFSQPTTLANHIRLIHTNEKPFECLHCGKRFVARNYLKYHIKKCTKEKLPVKKSQRKSKKESKGTDTVDIIAPNEGNIAQETDLITGLQSVAQHILGNSFSQEIAVEEQNDVSQIVLQPPRNDTENQIFQLSDYSAIERFLSENQISNDYSFPNSNIDIIAPNEGNIAQEMDLITKLQNVAQHIGNSLSQEIAVEQQNDVSQIVLQPPRNDTENQFFPLSDYLAIERFLSENQISNDYSFPNPTGQDASYYHPHYINLTNTDNPHNIYNGEPYIPPQNNSYYNYEF